MGRVWRWIWWGVKAGMAAVIVVVAVAAGWWLLQPTAPTESAVLAEEHRAPGVDAAAADSSSVLVQGVAEAMGLPSISIAAHVQGQLVWAAAFGLADLRDERPAALRTRYRAGSISKSMTGVLAGKLAAAGTIDLDRTVSDFLPDVPGNASPKPTLRSSARTPVGSATMRTHSLRASGASSSPSDTMAPSGRRFRCSGLTPCSSSPGQPSSIRRTGSRF